MANILQNESVGTGILEQIIYNILLVMWLTTKMQLYIYSVTGDYRTFKAVLLFFCNIILESVAFLEDLPSKKITKNPEHVEIVDI